MELSKGRRPTMARTTRRRTFVFEDTNNLDYRYIRKGLTQRGWLQIALPRVQPREGTREGLRSTIARNSCWVHRGGTMGVASVGLKDVTSPDLIWTLSSGRSPAFGSIGPQQATNFYGTSSCLTTKVIYNTSYIVLCTAVNQCVLDWLSGSNIHLSMVVAICNLATIIGISYSIGLFGCVFTANKICSVNRCVDIQTCLQVSQNQSQQKNNV